LLLQVLLERLSAEARRKSEAPTSNQVRWGRRRAFWEGRTEPNTHHRREGFLKWRVLWSSKPLFHAHQISYCYKSCDILVHTTQMGRTAGWWEVPNSNPSSAPYKLGGLRQLSLFLICKVGIIRVSNRGRMGSEA
jgi:hypothetical protein